MNKKYLIGVILLVLIVITGGIVFIDYCKKIDFPPTPSEPKLEQGILKTKPIDLSNINT